ncbi:hypothetical protein [Bradyrhizobium sp. 170]|uniref:hypothetical protein n=1 Tax=Bradyrhizobium sp. 170 TaxID=2782641 RepID=UPI001FFF01ED|nr:hypothetical protein [Bradyrhizobium sp. 170]UPK05832.1 hypothetical protein IVB05_09845 [Bradyrhizobium sp. 170]
MPSAEKLIVFAGALRHLTMTTGMTFCLAESMALPSLHAGHTSIIVPSTEKREQALTGGGFCTSQRTCPQYRLEQPIPVLAVHRRVDPPLPDKPTEQKIVVEVFHRLLPERTERLLP